MIIPEKKKAVSIILSKMNPEGKEESDESEDNMGVLEGISQDLIDAVKGGDKGKVAMSLKAAFDHLEMMPHEENEAEEEE